jgi:hypothetical protein
MRRVLCILFVLLLTLSGTVAQESDPETGVTFGGQLSGQITNAEPRLVYYFDGQRGEVISMRLQTTRGSLDPTLAVLDEAGTWVAGGDDSGGNRDVWIDALTIPRSSRYFVVVSRFGTRLGTTTGSFTLDMERIGVSSESGSALRYGDSVINNITNMQPQVYYSFRARRGDLVNIQMLRDSGDLDPYVQVVNSNAQVVADNDDVVGSGSLDATLTALLIPEDGTYIIVATRYGESAGTSSGRFILTLKEAKGSGFGNSPQAAVPLSYGSVFEDEVTADTPLKYYTFDARQNDLVGIRMSRSSGSLDSFLVLTDSNMQELMSDDDSGGGQNAEIKSFLVPADGRYYVLATRLDREQGTTAGRYKLELQTLGNAFDGVPEGATRLTYGTTITGRIDSTTPEVLFAFYGNENDAITVSLNRGDGDLDPTVSILDSNRNELRTDDDGGDGQNARIARFVLPQSGIYYIRATRFSGTDGNPNTQGSFTLVLARVFN